MIRMKCGACAVRGELKRASDGPFLLRPEQEARLVDRGVAEYVVDLAEQAAPEEPSKAIRYDAGMTMKQLQGIAAYLGLDASKAKKKQDVIDLLDAHFATGEDQEPEPPQEPAAEENPDAPNLGAEEPTA